MILETNRLLLRPWSETDAADLFSQASHHEVGSAAGWPVHQSVEESREIIKTVLSQPETYALVLKETGQVIGSIGLMLGKQGGLDLPDSEAEIGYWIGHSFWGQGLVPEASQVLLDYGFSQLNLEKVWCRAFVENSKSLRVQEKLGFVYQYLLEDVHFPLIDEVRSERVNLLTREEWQSRKEKLCPLHNSGKNFLPSIPKLVLNQRPGLLGRKLIDWPIWWLEASKPQPALPMPSTQ